MNTPVDPRRNNPGPPPLPGRPVSPPPPTAPPPPPPAATAPGQFHVTENTRTYPCPNCGDNLAFDPVSGQLACRSCGTMRAVTFHQDRRVGQHDLRDAALAGTRGLLAADDPAASTEHEVTCQNCGGRTVFTGTLTATRCPYCASPIQRDDVHAAPETIPVDGVVPFGVGEKQARESLEKWIHSRWFAPTEFKKYRQVGAFSSVYCSFFTYSTTAVTYYHGHRGDDYTVTVGEGENERTEIRTRWTAVSGTVTDAFTDVPALVNTGLDAQKIEALKPWPIDRARPFTGEFLAGHLARTYEFGPDEGFGIARAEEIDPAIQHSIRRDIGGDKQQISGFTPNFNPLRFRYLLMPVWLLTVMYANRPFQVFINGITGEVQGRRPVSKVKVAAAVICALVLLAAIVLAVRLVR
ncbi:MAG: TFIIB-type zinc ribbon-containing protein [Gordonia sp. (in: high G+C Gram-positive bacteria)]